MKVETRRAENYTSFFISFKVPFTNRTFRLNTLLYASPNKWVHGYSSRTVTGQYVLFMDYDALDLHAIRNEAKYLQKKFKLSNFYVFKLDRENSFHVICLDKFPLAQTYEILKQSSCDEAFINSIKRLQTKEWILRIGKKGERGIPKYWGCIKSDFVDAHEKSSAHKNFLKKCGVKEDYFVGKNWDKFSTLALVDYNTANRTE